MKKTFQLIKIVSAFKRQALIKIKYLWCEQKCDSKSSLALKWKLMTFKGRR